MAKTEFKINSFVSSSQKINADNFGRLVVLNSFNAQIINGLLYFQGGNIYLYKINGNYIQIIHNSGIIIETTIDICAKYFSVVEDIYKGGISATG